MNRIAIALSIVPLIPLLIATATMAINFRAPWQIVVIYLLGIAGVAGLLAAALRPTYDSRRRRLIAAGLLSCGYLSLAGLFTYLILGLETAGGSKAIILLYLLASMLLWPAVAGVFALHRLWHEQR